MKASELATRILETSKAASEASRTLALAGVGVVWVFQHKGVIPPALRVPTLCFVGALLCDTAQYVATAVGWRLVAWRLEKTPGTELDSAVPHTRLVRGVSGGFFYAKEFLLFAGYVWLTIALAPELLG